MWFFRSKEKELELSKKEAQIQAIHHDTLKKIDQANKSTKKLNDLIEKEDGGITELIFAATGGDRRK